MHGRVPPYFLLREGVDLCARYCGTQVYTLVAPAKHIHCPSYSSHSLSYSRHTVNPSYPPDGIAIANHGADLEPLSVGMCLLEDTTFVVISIHLLYRHVDSFNVGVCSPQPRIQSTPLNRGCNILSFI